MSQPPGTPLVRSRERPELHSMSSRSQSPRSQSSRSQSLSHKSSPSADDLVKFKNLNINEQRIFLLNLLQKYNNNFKKAHEEESAYLRSLDFNKLNQHTLYYISDNEQDIDGENGDRVLRPHVSTGNNFEKSNIKYRYNIKINGKPIENVHISKLTTIRTVKIIEGSMIPHTQLEGGKVSKTKTVKDVKKTIKEKATINPSVASNKPKLTPKPTPKPKIKN